LFLKLALQRFPGQVLIGGNSKIPSVVCYDANGEAIAVGSETDYDDNPELTEVAGLSRVEWYGSNKFCCSTEHSSDFKGLDIISVHPA
jgi:hypothetical protein